MSGNVLRAVCEGNSKIPEPGAWSGDGNGVICAGTSLWPCRLFTCGVDFTREPPKCGSRGSVPSYRVLGWHCLTTVAIAFNRLYAKYGFYFNEIQLNAKKILTLEQMSL